MDHEIVSPNWVSLQQSVIQPARTFFGDSGSAAKDLFLAKWAIFFSFHLTKRATKSVFLGSLWKLTTPRRQIILGGFGKVCAHDFATCQ